MEMIIGAIAIIGVLLILSALHSHGKTRKTNANDSRSWRENNADGSFTIHDKQGSLTISKTYDGGERYIDGHKCSTADDMERWYIKKGLSEGISRRLWEIEQELSRRNVAGGEELRDEWNRRYEDYRSLCKEHGFWNHVIDDRKPFIPTQDQIAKENAKKQAIDEMFNAWKQRMAENQVVLDYLQKCPRKHALKKDLLKDLSGGDPDKKKKIQAVYRRLIKAKVIAEKENQDGKLEVRIVMHKKMADKMPKPMPPSTFDPVLYRNVGKKEVYKVDYTVGEPINLDSENNTCFFVSKSSGDTYRTSLEKCSCPAYSKGYVCKHMVSLALRLGYLSRSEVLGK